MSLCFSIYLNINNIDIKYWTLARYFQNLQIAHTPEYRNKSYFKETHVHTHTWIQKQIVLYRNTHTFTHTPETRNRNKSSFNTHTFTPDPLSSSMLLTYSWLSPRLHSSQLTHFCPSQVTTKFYIPILPPPQLTAETFDWTNCWPGPRARNSPSLSSYRTVKRSQP